MTTTEAFEASLRAEFETWFRNEYHDRLCRNMPDKSYNDPTAHATWGAWQAATERAAKQEREECALVAQNMLDLEGDVGADDWTAEMGWDWACQKIRDAIRARDEGVSR